MKYYLRPGEAVELFLARAMRLMRLYMEEAFHRVMLGEEKPLRRRALCSLMTTMRMFESDMLLSLQSSLGLFYTFTLSNVRAMTMKIASPVEESSIDMCPRFEGVMRSEMRLEVISLLLVRDDPPVMMMTQDEVRCLIEHHGRVIEEGEEVPGRNEGPGLFEDIFEDHMALTPELNP